MSISSIRSAGNIRFRQPDEVDRCSTGVGKNTLVQGWIQGEDGGSRTLHPSLCGYYNYLCEHKIPPNDKIAFHYSCCLNKCEPSPIQYPWIRPCHSIEFSQFKLFIVTESFCMRGESSRRISPESFLLQ